MGNECESENNKKPLNYSIIQEGYCGEFDESKLDQSKKDIAEKQKKKCICQISGIKVGTGFFCKIPYKNELINVLITNYHIIDDNFLNNKENIELLINDKKIPKRIRIDNNRKIYSSEEYDIIIIKLKEVDEIHHFLELDNELFNYGSEIKYKLDYIYALHYPYGENALVSYSYGFENISKYEFEHRCNTEAGSSGSPILRLSSNKVIGIHKAFVKKKKINLGTFLKYILMELNDIKSSIKISNLSLSYQQNITEVKKENKISFANSICEISINQNNSIKGFGFLVSLPINIGNRYLYGLLTSNRILSKNELNVGNILHLNFKESQKTYNYQISENTFVFSCDFINISFVEIPEGFIRDIKYLKVMEKPYKTQKISIFQSNQKGYMDSIEGNIKGYFGTYILFNINGSYNINPICTPIISQEQESIGHIVAIKQSNSLHGEYTKYYSGINVNILLLAIKSLVKQKKTTASETLSQSKKLSSTEIDLLKNAGLVKTQNPNVFISPESSGVTPLWFYRTHYAWYWTPTKPQSFDKYNLDVCNWSLIHKNFPIKAIGGFWDDLEPAPRNIILINSLIKSGLKFLLD